MHKNERKCYVSSDKGETKVVHIEKGIILKTLFRKRVGKAENSDDEFVDELEEEMNTSEEDAIKYEESMD